MATATVKAPAAASTSDVPRWVTEGWNDDPLGLRIAVRRYHDGAVSPRERARVRAFIPDPTFGCTGCGRFAFALPTLCFWCRRA